MAWLEEIERLDKTPEHGVSANFKKIEYGTAGFRDKGSTLNHVVFRMGILAAFRSHYLGKSVGIMITASHNPAEDNGLKIVDPDGEMLAAEWEIIATEVANSLNLKDTLSKLAVNLKINLEKINTSFPLVVIGRDTRPSSIVLWKGVIAGLSEALKFPFIDCGVVTTPQLHFVVQKLNQDYLADIPKKSLLDKVVLPSLYLDRYFDEICEAFLEHVQISEQSSAHTLPVDLVVDCANGVGLLAVNDASKKLHSKLNLIAVNVDHGCPDKLNFQCGADFVKVQQKPPTDVESLPDKRYASFDGDADRIVYYYLDPSDNHFCLLDGDKIATLIAGYVGNLLKKANLQGILSMGLVQTAYANGSSTSYICDKLKVPVVCVPTGVKHLHKAAHKFDIGVYFEANGHGTVIFSEKAGSVLSERAKKCDDKSDETNQAILKLDCLRRMINPAVGDALTDLLAVEAILIDLGWSLMDWNNCYSDLPSRQLKVKIKNRSDITTEDAERRCVKPEGLQDAIDILVSKTNSGRSFIRPSGTEDIVRVYAEAENQAAADWLAYDVAMTAFRLAGGIAPEPVKPSFERP